MYFQHADEIWRDFPQLVPVALLAEGITAEPSPEEVIERFEKRAAARLAGTPAGQLPEIQAWRRAFSQMGLKPTQYRCASESLLRRYAKEGSLPRIHPLVDLCNAVSLASALPIAVIDLARVVDGLEVRPATGAERLTGFLHERFDIIVQEREDEIRLSAQAADALASAGVSRGWRRPNAARRAPRRPRRSLGGGGACRS